MKKDKIKGLVASVVIITMSFGLCGCGNKSTDNRIVVEMVQYKPEAADYFEQLENKESIPFRSFNAYWATIYARDGRVQEYTN